MRSSHDSNIRNSRSPNCASSFSSRNTAAIFSWRALGREYLSADFSTEIKSCSRRISRRQCRTARRNSAVYQPCDLTSSLKNHCTPAACSAEPPPLSALRICAATSAGVPPNCAEPSRHLFHPGRLYPNQPVINPQQSGGGHADCHHRPPDHCGRCMSSPK